jgi:tripartite-type tricarboxylate transporter receptor subunit TctC
MNTFLARLGRRSCLLLGGLALCAPVLSQAQAAYPNKPINILVAYAPGGQGDVFARLVGERLGQAYKQSVVVENRPGVSGTLGTRLAVKAKNDGYNLFLGQTGEITVNRLLVDNLGYDPLKDFVPVVKIGNAPLVMLAPKDAPYNTVAELIAVARTKPGEFNYGSVGQGTPGHLSAAALALGSNLSLTHVPYKGVGPLLADLSAGRLQFFFSSISAAMPQIKGGKLKALAVTTLERVKSLPDVPTVSESALKGFSYTLWGGLFAPAGTPQAIIDSLNREVNAILASGPIHDRFVNDGVAVPANTPAEFATFVQQEADKFQQLVAKANLNAPK